MPIITGSIVADEINGTCQCLETVIERLVEEEGYLLPENDLQLYEELDNICFLCDQCGWWYDIGDMAEDDSWRCTSCEGEDE